jgi:hypothetical protein
MLELWFSSGHGFSRANKSRQFNAVRVELGLQHRMRRLHPLPLFQKDVIPKGLRGRVCKRCDSKGVTEKAAAVPIFSAAAR